MVVNVGSLLNYSVLCTLYVLSGVTIEAEAGMSIYKARSIRPIAQPPQCMQGVCLYESCAAAVTIVTVRVSLLGESWAVYFCSTQPGSHFLIVQASMPYASIALSDPCLPVFVARS